MKIQPQSKLIIIGDSITDCGRAKPVGDGRLSEVIGNGYVGFVAGLLSAFYPEQPIRVINMGASGNTARDLKNRWQGDVLDLKPDWLSIMIGINDVWRQFDLPLQHEKHVLIDEYEQTLDELVEAALPLLKGLVLMTPFYIEQNRGDAMRAMMDRYGAVVKKVAQKHGAILIDTQAYFDEALDHYHSTAIAWDRIHPNITGHMLLARAFLDGIGFCWKPGPHARKTEA